MIEHIVVKGLPVARRHHHIDTRIDGLGTVIVRTTKYFANTVPVTDDHALETHVVTKKIGQDGFATVNFLAVPTIE